MNITFYELDRGNTGGEEEKEVFQEFLDEYNSLEQTNWACNMIRLCSVPFRSIPFRSAATERAVRSITSPN